MAQPKQFHALTTSHTLIQETALRFRGEVFRDPLVICGESHKALVEAQLSDIGCKPERVILEPFGRNTAAVATLAALAGEELDPEALILLLPADHIITKPHIFINQILKAVETAKDYIVTFGIRPTYPETGFGYIARGQALTADIFKVDQFLEKPDFDTAKSYVLSGNHDWNAGIFLFSPGILLQELAFYAPEILNNISKSYKNARREGRFLFPEREMFFKAPSMSLDYAVMEKTQRAAILPCEIGWSDIGNFAELWRHGTKDPHGNHTLGQVLLFDTENSLIRNECNLPLSIIGLSNIIVVATDEGIVVCPLELAQDIKKAAEALKALRPDKRC